MPSTAPAPSADAAISSRSSASRPVKLATSRGSVRVAAAAPPVTPAAGTASAGARPRAAASNAARAGPASPSASASSRAVSLRAVGWIPRSRSLTDRGLSRAASASSSWVRPASTRSCRSNWPNVADTSPPRFPCGRDQRKPRQARRAKMWVSCDRSRVVITTVGRQPLNRQRERFPAGIWSRGEGHVHAFPHQSRNRPGQAARPARGRQPGSARPDGCTPGRGPRVTKVAGPWSRRWPRRRLYCWSWSWPGAAAALALPEQEAMAAWLTEALAGVAETLS